MSAVIPPRPDVFDGIGPPKATWSWYEAIGVYVLAFLIGGVASFAVLVAFGGTESTSGGLDGIGAWATIAADIAITGALLFWLSRWHRRWPETIVLAKAGRGIREFLRGYLLGLPLYFVIAVGVGLVVGSLLRAVSGQDVTGPEQLSTEHLSVGSVVAFILLALVVAPVSEEFFFRGILFRGIRDRFGFWPGAIGSGLLFGLVHYVPDVWRDSVFLMAIMVFTGIALAWLYERRGNLVANIGAHVAFNSIGLAFYFFVK